MNGTDVRPVKPEQSRGLQISVEPQLCALSDRYAARGLRQSVRASAAKQIEKEEQTKWQEMSVAEHVEFYISQGMEKKEAMKAAASDRGMSKRDIYQALLEK